MLLDLTHTVYPGMPVYPGTETPVFKQVNTLEKDGFAEKKILFYSHTGTHMDAPSHLLKGAPTLDQYSMDVFTGKGIVLDLHNMKDRLITLEQIRSLSTEIRDHAYILFYTGWDQFWGTDQYYKDYPILSKEAASYLAEEFQLKGIGVDTISVDMEDTWALPVHRALLGKGILIIENLTNLQCLLRKIFDLYTFPLKLQDADGAPVRAAAHVQTIEKNKNK